MERELCLFFFFSCGCSNIFSMNAFAEETRLCNIRSSSFWDADISMDNVVVLVGNISWQTKTYIHSWLNHGINARLR